MRLYAGTSGFSYDEWKGVFYPEDLAADDRLRFYAERLPAVEINNTFYRLPKKGVLASWAAQVPEGFRFVIKASRRITHQKRLADAAGETDYLLRTVATGLYHAGLTGVLSTASGYLRRAPAFSVFTYHRVNDHHDPFFEALPVDVRIPGCPPSPESLLEGLGAIRGLIGSGD